MNAPPKAALEAVFPRVLEESAFLFAEPSDTDGEQNAPDDAVCVSIDFTGARSGSLNMAISTSLGREISMNLIGNDQGEAVPDSAAHDALGELLNVTCGNVLTEIAGEKPVFNLSVPRIAPISAEEWKSFFASPDMAAFKVDGQIVLTRIVLRD